MVYVIHFLYLCLLHAVCYPLFIFMPITCCILFTFYYCSLCRAGRTHGESVVYVPDSDGILNDELSNEVTPTQETPITLKTSTQESLSDSEDLHSKLVPRSIPNSLHARIHQQTNFDKFLTSK